MRTSYRVAMVALIVAVLSAAIWEYRRMSQEVHIAREAAKQAQAALKSERRAVALREKLRASTAAKQASAGVRLEAAVESNKAWADTPVPQEVQDALAD